MLCIDIPLFPDIPPSATAQVVHSAGRRFIVSPVPEARLKEQAFPTSPPPAPASPAEMGQNFFCVWEAFKGQLTIQFCFPKKYGTTGACLQHVL